MWFIADFFERYTSSVARTFIKMAGMEVEASRRALYDARSRQLAATCAAAVSTCTRTEPAPQRRDAAVPAAAVAPVAPAAVAPALPVAPVPMGVRGDVVAHYLAAFADPAAGPALVERLRKDKRVRVAELKLIAADVLDEEPATRKKGEHLDALRRHVAAPAERPTARLEPQPRHA